MRMLLSNRWPMSAKKIVSPFQAPKKNPGGSYTSGTGWCAQEDRAAGVLRGRKRHVPAEEKCHRNGVPHHAHQGPTEGGRRVFGLQARSGRCGEMKEKRDGGLPQVGVLRLRGCFASRSGHSAQDDTLWRALFQKPRADETCAPGVATARQFGHRVLSLRSIHSTA